MKAIMYHYVRSENSELPYFRYLHIDNFVKQLEYFGNKYGFVSLKELQDSLKSGVPADGIILTFDDGFKDHFQNVLPILQKYNLWGIFYPITSHFITNKINDVHRIHVLIGKYGGSTITDAILGIVNDNMLSHNHIEEFQTETYNKQKNDADTNYIKRLLNYFIDYKYRKDIINQLMSVFYPNEKELVEEFYMTKYELKKMNDAGMILGSHSVNHPVMSKLSIKAQEKEIIESSEMIDSITGKTSIKTFSYPYGGFYSFTSETEKLLEKNGFQFSFNVEPRDINQLDFKNRIYALPRYDCNQFIYGASE